jgi:hypothetical protein
VTDQRAPAGVDRTFADKDLATVHTRMAATAPGKTGIRGLVEVDLPGTLTEHYTPGQQWNQEFAQYGTQREHLLWSTPRTFRKGQVTTSQWNTAVFGPSLPMRPGRLFTAERVFDQLSFGIPMFGDGGAREAGFSDTAAAAKTVLYRGDQVIGESSSTGGGFFTVPAEAATYRLHSEMTQTGSTLSSAVAADWTFASAPGVGNQVLNLPLLAVRFLPRLDDHNAAPSSVPFSFDVVAQRNGVGLVSSGIALTVDASYDDGATWQPASVTAARGGWTASVQHPAGPGFVSLRATATDADGNAVHETITRAYALR